MPLKATDLRLRYSGGTYIVDQTYIVTQHGHADEYPDQLADLEGPVGTEQWTPLESFIDLNEALLYAFILMVEDTLDLRSIDTSLLSPADLDRALTQLNLFKVL